MRQQQPARSHPPVFAVCAVLLVAFSTYVVLDTFVLQRTYAVVATQPQEALAQEKTAQTSEQQVTEQQVTEQQVVDQQDARITVGTTRYLSTSVYVVDIYAEDASAICAAFANDAYGHNVSDATSSIAEDHGALVAINGDCYGNRNAGYVIRNGVLYRDESAGDDQEDLVIYADGTFSIVREGDVTAQELVDKGAWQVFSFGPGLVSDGEITVSEGDEVGRAKASNPRTALGKVSDGHYVFVVADGRTQESEGLSLLELATFMRNELAVECAYNLDGGGSTTLYYNGDVVNNPTSSGRSIKERSVTDIVYLAK